MITDADVKKLVKEFKKVFATKEYIKTLTISIDSLDKKIDKIYVSLAEDLGNIMKDIREIKSEFRGQRIVSADFENRIQYLEEKVGTRNNLAEFKKRVDKLRLELKQNLTK